MKHTRRLVCVVDDDESVRESLPDLLKQLGYEVRAFASPEAFLASDSITITDCLILDINMPGMSGPELQRELRDRGKDIPTIFITAKASAPSRLRQLKQNASAVLIKPFSYAALREALNSALNAS